MLGRALSATEHAVACAWSLGEVALMLSRGRARQSTRGESQLRADLATRGFYTELPERPALRGLDAGARVLVGDNPYRFHTEETRPEHRVVARFVPSRRPTDRLVVVFHCYGVPSPRLMGALFGLHERDDVDVVYPIMNHHQRGHYPLWPGSGLTHANAACMLENLRSVVTGARTVVRALQAAREYRRTTVIGFSIGGQLAMHVANTERVDRVLLYAPVVSVARTARELGLMRRLHPRTSRIGRWVHPSYDEALLAHADPLRYPLRVPEESVDVIAHRHDAMTPPHQLEPIRARYPRVGWHELDGTHVVPRGRAYLKRLVHRAV